MEVPAGTKAAGPRHAVRDDRARSGLGTAAMALVNGGIVAALSVVVTTRGRPGLSVGTEDHVVLAPRGLRLADPTAFAGDWFTDAAPQPHWLFDLVVAAGRASGHLVGVLVLYWLLTCLIFGAAVAVTARAWAPRAAWPAAILVSIVATCSPFTVAGSTWLGIPSAVPNMLGAALLTLLTACLLAGRYRWLLVLLPVLAAVHVQIGAIGLVLTALAAVALWLWRGGPDAAAPGDPVRLSRTSLRPVAPYVAAWLASAGIVVAAMLARRVAADRSDFVEICDTYIPYHCSAATWDAATVLTAVACALLACACVAAIPAGRRLLFALTVGVCAVGMVAAMFIDRLHVPVLGELVQALNGYRVVLAMYPYAIWGLVLPVLRPVRSALGAAAAVAAVVAMPFFFTGSISKITVLDRELALAPWAPLLIAGCTALVLLQVAAGLADRRTARGAAAAPPASSGRLARAAVAVGAVGLLVWSMAGLAAAGVAVARPRVPLWGGDKPAQDWGVAARAIIPPGAQVVTPPSAAYYRLPLERGIVADCKDIPYGGAPYAEWKRRLDDLGGWKDCIAPKHDVYDNLPASRLIAAAKRYGATAIITKPGENRPQVRDLIAAGWRYHHVRSGWIDSAILLAP